MPRDLTDAAARVDSLKRRRPHAHQLACVLSLAARIEFALLRRARLLLSDADASAEADLCHSDIVVSQTPQGIVFDSAAAEILRAQLAEDVRLLDQSWALISSAHRHAAWPIRSEEEVNRWSLSTDPAAADQIQRILLATAREMVEAKDPIAAARWTMRALMRLPESASDSAAGRTIQAGVAAQLDGRLDLETANLPPDAFENWFPWLIGRGAPTASIPVSLLDGFLELGETTREPSGRVEIPDTKPFILDLRWHDGLAAHSERVAFEAGEQRQLRITAQEVELRAIDGRRYRLRAHRAHEFTRGIDFSAIRARHRPFVGRESELQRMSSLVGANISAVTGSPFFAITGDPGIGKTALLCACLDAFETRGDRVLSHFGDGGPDAWSRPDTIEASLLAQMADWPSGSTGDGDNPSLDQALRRHAEQGPIVVFFDGLQWPAAFPQSFPPAVRLVHTTRTSLAPGESGESALDLNTRRESNEDVCRQYLRINQAMLDHAFPDDKETAPTVRVRSIGKGDERIAREVWAALKSGGIDVNRLLDDVLQPGDDWLKKLDDPVQAFDVTVLLVGDNSVESPWLRHEIAALVASGKPIIPVLFRANPSWISALRDPAFLPVVHIKLIAGELDPTGSLKRLVEEVRQALPLTREDASTRLLQRADGNIGRLVAMMDWLAAQPDRIDVRRMPPTLYGAFERVWSELRSAGNIAVVEYLGGLLAAAPEPLPLVGLLHELLAPDRDVAEGVLKRFEEAGLVIVTEEGDVSTGDARRAALSHASVREALLERLGADRMRSFHAHLAEWGGSNTPYGLRHRVWHLIAAGNIDEARACMADVGFLMRVLELGGVVNLEQQLADAAKRAIDTTAVLAGHSSALDVESVAGPNASALTADRPVEADDVFQRLLAAVRSHRKALQAHPTDLPSILPNALAAASPGSEWSAIEAIIKDPSGRPFLRFTRSLDIPVGALSVTRDRHVTACAAASDLVIAGTDDGELIEWPGQPGDVEGAPTVVPAHRGSVSCLSFWGDNELLLSGGSDGTVLVWDASSFPSGGMRSTFSRSILRPPGKRGPTQTLAGPEVEITRVVLSRDNRLAAGAVDGSIRVWDRQTGELKSTLVGHTGSVTSLAASTNHSVLVSGSTDGTLRVWDLMACRLRAILRGHGGPITGCAILNRADYGREGLVVVSVSTDGLLKLWTADGQDTATLGGHTGPVRDLRLVAPDYSSTGDYGTSADAESNAFRGAVAVTCADDGTVRVWDIDDRVELQVIRGHRGPVSHVGAITYRSGALHRVLSSSGDGTCRLYDSESGHLVRELRIGSTPVSHLSVSQSGAMAACVTDAGELARIDLTEAAEPGSEAARVIVALNRNGDQVMIGAGRRVRIVALGGESPIGTSDREPATVLSVATNRAATLYATLCQGGTVRYWSSQGEPTGTFTVAADTAAIGTSPSGSLLLTGTVSGLLQTWRHPSSSELKPELSLVGGAGVLACACDMSEQRAASAHADGSLRLWNLTKGTVDEEFRLEGIPALDCDVSHDGSMVLSAWANGTIAVWNVSSRQVTFVREKHEGAVTGCWIDRRVDRAVTCSRDGTVKLWDLTLERCLDTFYGDAPFVSLSAAPGAPIVAATDEAGKVWILRNTDSDAPAQASSFVP